MFVFTEDKLHMCKSNGEVQGKFVYVCVLTAHQGAWIQGCVFTVQNVVSETLLWIETLALQWEGQGPAFRPVDLLQIASLTLSCINVTPLDS